MYYVVTAYRFGDTERHSYVVGIENSIEKALELKQKEEDWRGGKYSCGIAECEVGNKTLPIQIVEPTLNLNVARPGAAVQDLLKETLLWGWVAEQAILFIRHYDVPGCSNLLDDNGCVWCAASISLRAEATCKTKRILTVLYGNI